MNYSMYAQITIRNLKLTETTPIQVIVTDKSGLRGRPGVKGRQDPAVLFLSIAWLPVNSNARLAVDTCCLTAVQS